MNPPLLGRNRAKCFSPPVGRRWPCGFPMVSRGVPWSPVARGCPVRCCAMLCDAMLCCAMLRDGMLYCAMLRYAMRCYAMRRYAMRCNTMRHYVIAPVPLRIEPPYHPKVCRIEKHTASRGITRAPTRQYASPYGTAQASNGSEVSHIAATWHHVASHSPRRQRGRHESSPHQADKTMPARRR